VTLDLVEVRDTHLVSEERSTEDGRLCYMHLAAVRCRGNVELVFTKCGVRERREGRAKDKERVLLVLNQVRKIKQGFFGGHSPAPISAGAL
jgi:hypothetical protein